MRCMKRTWVDDAAEEKEGEKQKKKSSKAYVLDVRLGRSLLELSSDVYTGWEIDGALEDGGVVRVVEVAHRRSSPSQRVGEMR